MSYSGSGSVVPKHVAIVMDGNGRWAVSRGLKKVDGHRAGAKAAKKLIPHAKSLGIEYLTLFTFSKENWGREKDEVQGILALILEELHESEAYLKQQDVRFRVIGSLDDFPIEMAQKIRLLEQESQNRQGLCVVFALSYGARQDITQATAAIARKVSSGQLASEEIDESVIESHLSTAGMPPPELFIRSSGELRLSNFLLWELAYTEMHFTTCLWPDFTHEHFTAALDSYALRRRCFGKSRHV